ncbi:5-formyltetrahydrofolate cyclo-ligase [bacterium]|nr:MAG: 5-formyltetrahydrofolate cyclo-ligase [bacterium]
MSEILTQEKQKIRQRMKSVRQALSPSEVQEGSRMVTRSCLDCVEMNTADLICTYVGVGKEIRTDSLIERLLESGRKVLVPDWEGWKQGSGLRIVRIKSLDDLTSENRIVPQPRVSEERLVRAEDVEVFVVPGLAFDVSGNRLGMGGGYFDRLLSLSSPFANLIGLAYDFQVIDRLPVGNHDVPVHHVISPLAGVIQGDLHKRRIYADDIG